MHHDIVVIGGGPAGWTAAMEGSALGLDVMLVDRGRSVGGGFVHTGTLPSKILREMALARRRAERAAPDDAQPDPASVGDFSREVQRAIERHVPSLEQMLASSSVQVRFGSASFASPNELRIATPDSEEIVHADKIIVASGSRPRRPDGIPFDGCVVRDCDSILRTETVPARLVVIGAGFAGCELACTFAALGSSVTLVDRRRRILRALDGEIRELAIDEAERMGIRLRTGDEIEAVCKVRTGDRWQATVELRDEVIDADCVLVALGREANTLSLDVEKAGVAVDDTGWIKVDECFRTSASHVYAVGDVTGTTGLGGASAFQGRIAARHAAGRSTGAHAELPIVYYTIPEVAMIGLTEEACRELGVAHTVGTARYSQVARTHVMSGGEGLLKLLVRREDGAIVGVHVAGEQASELIQLATLLMAQGGTVETLLDMPYAFPTLSELYRLAAMDAIAGL